MQDANNPLLFLETSIKSLVGHVVSSTEVNSLLETLNAFRYPVCQNITWHLENLSRFRVTVGFFLARAEQSYREEEAKLNKIFSRRYNDHRNAGLASKLGRSPPAEAIKNQIKGDSEYLGQQGVVSNAEYRRDILRELKDALSSKSREVDQLTNNARLEARIDLT